MGLGFRVLGFRVVQLGREVDLHPEGGRGQFRVLFYGFRVQGLGFRVLQLGREVDLSLDREEEATLGFRV
jgi:hypothetical protein